MSSLWRSTPFRLLIMLGGAFIVFVGLTGFVAYALIQSELDARLERQLQESFTVIAQSYGENDLTDLSETVQSNATAHPNHDRVFLLRDEKGMRIAGNITEAPVAEGRQSVAPERLGLPAGDALYRLYYGTVGPYALVVGANRAEVEDIGRIVLSSLGWAGVAFLFIATSIAAVLALQGRRRLEDIASTMARVGRGDLEARLRLSGNGDDVDQLSEQVNRALDRLSSVVEGMRQVSVDIAHDLKTPLNRLSLVVQNAITENARGRDVTGLLSEAEQECRQIAATFDALLRIAQIEAGARRAKFRDTDLGAILLRLAEAYTDVAFENRQQLTLSLGDNLPPVLGDKDLLTQLFANLIENAIRHCPQGTVIALDARVESGALQVTVADNGPGVPQAERDKVFQRLYRLDKSRGTQGYGLGLSLVRAVADLHEASITLGDAQPGSRFTVIFQQPG
ncbi:MAG TPA: HAMP domain-containing sensor histidine kinase [Devosia sp.]|nr:HAMP domain-containing sensor histidine kinase [Devosia sp.]